MCNINYLLLRSHGHTLLKWNIGSRVSEYFRLSISSLPFYFATNLVGCGRLFSISFHLFNFKVFQSYIPYVKMEENQCLQIVHSSIFRNMSFSHCSIVVSALVFVIQCKLCVSDVCVGTWVWTTGNTGMLHVRSTDEFQTSMCSNLGSATGCHDSCRSVIYLSHSRPNCRPTL